MNNNDVVPCVPVLPNLITSTDETTVFATPSKIFDKERVYLVARPTAVKNERIDSGKCNHYSTDDSGDAHCRGVRIVLNNTFTGGGLAAPIFAVIYGLTPDELPNGDDILTIPVPGLTVGADQNIYNTKEGYIVFVRGNHCKDNFENHENENDNEIENDDEDDGPTYSKEARVAKLYRTLVYQPFIRDIRMTQYGWSGEGPVPDDLEAVSWMDGAYAQLQQITAEENLDEEKDLKISSCKHSAARTGSEQAANLFPGFKLLKKDLKTKEISHQNMNPIVLFLRKKLNELENDNILKLKSHKKKALMFAAPNLPSATGSAFTVQNIRKGFIYNGQLDTETTSVPCFHNLIHTFCGNTGSTCLDNRKWLMDTFFEEMFLNGTIKESTFDRHNIPLDVDSKGEPVLKSNDITMENRHRSKILTSEVQIKERRLLVNEKRLKEYALKKKLFDSEQKDVGINTICELKLANIVVKAKPDLPVQMNNQGCIDFHSVHGHLNLAMLQENASSLLNSDLKSFIRVRSERILKRNKLSFSNIPTTKDQLLKRCFELVASPYHECLCTCPTYPSLLPVDD